MGGNLLSYFTSEFDDKRNCIFPTDGSFLSFCFHLMADEMSEIENMSGSLYALNQKNKKIRKIYGREDEGLSEDVFSYFFTKNA